MKRVYERVCPCVGPLADRSVNQLIRNAGALQPTRNLVAVYPASLSYYSIFSQDEATLQCHVDGRLVGVLVSRCFGWLVG